MVALMEGADGVQVPVLKLHDCSELVFVSLQLIYPLMSFLALCENHRV